MSIQDGVKLPSRPGYGTKGKPVTLWTNYFELLPSKDQPFNRYAVSFLPDGNDDKKGEEPKGKKLERLISLLLMQLPETVPCVSDYRSTILTATTLGFTTKEYTITYRTEAETVPRASAPKYRARVQFTATLTFATLLDYLSSTNIDAEVPPEKESVIQASNIVLGHGFKASNAIIAKRNKYFPAAGNLMEQWQLGNGLLALRGFFMSVRAGTGRMLLNVQIQNIPSWKVQPLTTLLDELRAKSLSMNEMSRTIAGLWVHCSHLQNRLRRIAGFADPRDGQGKSHAPQIPQLGANAIVTKFYMESSKKYISVSDYFRNAHAPLKMSNFPVVNVGTRQDPIYMPAEVCMIKSLQDFDRKLSPDGTAAMIKFAVRRPEQNASTIIQNGLGLLKAHSEKYMNAFGMKLNPDLLTVKGRILPGNSLIYAGKTLNPRDGGWNMQGTKFSSCAAVEKWSWIWVPGRNSRLNSMEDARKCVAAFHEELKNCGVRAPAPVDGRQLQLQNSQNPTAEIEAFFKRAVSAGMKLLLVILPDTGSVLYNAVKKAGDVTYGIHTVNVVADSRKFAKALETNNAQYFANVALKVNLKFGGQNQLLQPADLGFVGEGKCMVVGMDVTHPAPGSSSSAPSVATITASTDAKLGQWPADVSIQYPDKDRSSKEIIENLKELFKSRLILWQEKNKSLPEELLVYRDGVSEGMYDLVTQKELPQIRAACAELYPATVTKANKPYLTIIICGKRHHTRFYPADATNADPRTGNNRPGTVVDRSITDMRLWDFYLQSHNALHGTARPCHYVVIHDEIFRRRAAAKKPNDGRNAGQRAHDDLEALTHAMCFMFGRATKAVSLCPPAYYADLVADRARRYLSHVFDERESASSHTGTVSDDEVKIHPNIKNSMFYI